MGYSRTKKVVATTQTPDGSPAGKVVLVVPTDLPSDERAEELRELFKKYVHTMEPGGSWKGPCYALVPSPWARDVQEAMAFHGAIVNYQKAVKGHLVLLMSDGYWANGF